MSRKHQIEGQATGGGKSHLTLLYEAFSPCSLRNDVVRFFFGILDCYYGVVVFISSLSCATVCSVWLAAGITDGFGPNRASAGQGFPDQVEMR